MPYSNKTPYFGIPFVSEGETIIANEEKKASNIIENQLLAGLKGVKCSVFEEGHFKLVENNDGTCLVSLSKNSMRFALCGVVGGAYVESEEPIVWDGLEIGHKYYLYVQYTNQLFEDEHAFRVIFSTTKKTDNSIFLLLAHVDLKNDNKIINSNPEGKIYSNDIASHTTDKENPHGETLYQDSIVIKKNILFEMNEDYDGSCVVLKDSRKNKNGKKPTIESTSDLALKDKRLEICLSDDENLSLKTENKSLIGAINELGSLKSKLIEIETFGSSGVEISIEEAEKIEFVGYNQIQVGSSISFQNIGTVIFGYYLEDETVKNKSCFKFYNNGEAGIKVKLFVTFR